MNEQSIKRAGRAGEGEERRKKKKKKEMQPKERRCNLIRRKLYIEDHKSRAYFIGRRLVNAHDPLRKSILTF